MINGWKFHWKKIGDKDSEHYFNIEETTFLRQEFYLSGFATTDISINVDLCYNCIHRMKGIFHLNEPL